MMTEQNLIEVEELELNQIRVRDRETDEEKTAWEVDHPEMERPCRGDSPQEALDIFAECIGKDDDEKTAINLDELAE